MYSMLLCTGWATTKHCSTLWTWTKKNALKNALLNITDYVSQTAEEENPEETFHKVIGKLIHKKLHDEAIYSKLVSFTASGREEKCEKPTTRAASVIIHDHGIVCLWV